MRQWYDSKALTTGYCVAQLKILLNKNVLSLDLKQQTELQHKTDSGKVFHNAVQPAEKHAWWTQFVVLSSPV